MSDGLGKKLKEKENICTLENKFKGYPGGVLKVKMLYKTRDLGK